jgi:tetratricopeptide (TPR) repeat protein
MEASATTEEQLRRTPNDAQRIFDHAQSVYWVGSIALERGDPATAERQFQEYHRLAERLVEADPNKPEWRIEIAYALTNLGNLAARGGDFVAARSLFLESAGIKEALLAAKPDDFALIQSLGQSYSWQARQEIALGRNADAQLTLGKELSLYSTPLRNDPNDARFLRPRIVAARALSKARLNSGAVAESYAACAEARPSVLLLTSLEPANVEFKTQYARLLLEKAQILVYMNKKVEANSLAIERDLYTSLTQVDRLPISMASRGKTRHVQAIRQPPRAGSGDPR